MSLNGVTLVVSPVTSQLVERADPRWVLTCGLLLLSVGNLWAATISVHDRNLGSMVGPLLGVGLGFAFTVTSISAVAVNTVPIRLVGMASGATSLLRDFGLTLGPAVVSAVALSRAAHDFSAGLANSALGAPVKQAAGTLAEKGGVLAVNSAPPASPPGAAAPIAIQALGGGYSLGYLVSGIAALVAAVLAAAILGGRARAATSPIDAE